MVNHCRLDCCNSTAAGNSEFKGSFNLTTALAGNENKKDCEHSGKTIAVKAFVTLQINVIEVCIILVFTTEEFSDNHDLLVMKKNKNKKNQKKQEKNKAITIPMYDKNFLFSTMLRDCGKSKSFQSIANEMQPKLRKATRAEFEPTTT